MKPWIVDDEPSGRYPIYTRGNVGEVFPTVVSPLTWSVFGREAELGWRDAFCRWGAVSEKDLGDEPMVVLGVFGGYCYLNVSFIRLFAVRTPGLTVDDMDRQLFGESEAPPYRRRPGDRSPMASVRVAGTLLRTLRAKALPALDQDRQDVIRWLNRQPEVITASDSELIGVIRGFQPMFRRLFDHHIMTTFQSMVGPGLVQKLTTEKLGDPTLMVSLLGGIGSVDSAEPSVALWDLGRMVAEDPALTAIFDAGLDGLEDRLSEVSAFEQQFAEFTRVYGSRGPNEWEGSSPTWGTSPELALAAIDCMRRADPSHSPRVQQAELERKRHEATDTARSRLRGAARKQFDLALRSAQLFSQGRERSKTTVILGLHGVRLAQLELARRARDRGGPDALVDMWLIKNDELDDYMGDPKRFLDALDERRQRRDLLQGLIPPFVFEGQPPPISEWASRAGEPAPSVEVGTRLQGIPGCPGVARGRARVILDPADPRGLGPGDVLVAPITDPSWTPLFVAAEAVVVDVGAQLSHAVIVSRELGIPAVVSVTGATRAIPDGAMVEVDGTTGVVRLLSL
jgi:phosphohistidine swiveling domain-containing protein